VSDLYDSCTNTRFRASIQLDEELSELDAARLRAHLEACPACALWVAEADALTVLLRQSELDEPVHWRMPRVAVRRVSFPRTAALAGATASVAAAALAVLAVAFPAAPGFHDSGMGTSLKSPLEVDAARAVVGVNRASSAALSAQPNKHYPGPT
jgi:anti-sigma factor RsiW